MSYSEDCPCCGQVQDFSTKREWQTARRRWVKRARRFVEQESAQHGVNRTAWTVGENGVGESRPVDPEVQKQMPSTRRR